MRPMLLLLLMLWFLRFFYAVFFPFLHLIHGLHAHQTKHHTTSQHQQTGLHVALGRGNQWSVCVCVCVECVYALGRCTHIYAAMQVVRNRIPLHSYSANTLSEHVCVFMCMVPGFFLFVLSRVFILSCMSRAYGSVCINTHRVLAAEYLHAFRLVMPESP